jgi:hypothetical protein
MSLVDEGIGARTKPGAQRRLLVGTGVVALLLQRPGSVAGVQKDGHRVRIDVSNRPVRFHRH